MLSFSLSGWIVSLAALKNNVPVGAIMMINAICFTGQTAMGVVMLKKVSAFIYFFRMISLLATKNKCINSYQDTMSSVTLRASFIVYG